MAVEKKPIDTLPEKEIARLCEENGGQVIVAGRPYVFVMTFGWAEVAFFVRTIAPHRMLLANGSFFVNAGKDYGRLAREGGDESCQWRYEGDVVEINPLHVLKTLPYHGVIHKGEPLPAVAAG